MTDTDQIAPSSQGSVDRRDLLRGLVYIHNRANANTMEAHQANASVYALTELLFEEGILDRKSFEARREETAEQLHRGYVDRGMAVAMQQFPGSKYDFDGAADIDCQSRIALCKAACCKLPFALSKEDVQEGVVRWNLGQPYMIAQGGNGYCIHKKTGNCQCSVYNQRPIPCRGYDCSNDKRIWLDFDKQVVNPRMNDRDWPGCLENARKENGLSSQPQAVNYPGKIASESVTVNNSSLNAGAGAAVHRRPLQFQRATIPAPPISIAAQQAIAEQHRNRGQITITGDRSANSNSTLGSKLRERISESLEHLVRPELHMFGRTWPAYGVFVHLGIVLGIALAVWLSMRQGLSIAMMGGIATAGVLGAVFFAFATKMLTGGERFTFYHYQILITLIAGAVLWHFNQPVLPYLDSTLLAMGLILAIGRIGCLMAGCCHGRPHPWGVSYSHAHASAGFAPAFVGVRLIPVQAIESLWLLLLVAAASGLIVMGRSPGEPLLLYLMGYGAGRFVFEFSRGDAARPYVLGFSEAQWTSVVLMGVAVAAGIAGFLPLQPWHVLVFVFVVLTLITVTLVRHVARESQFGLLHPQHISEVAELLGEVEGTAGLNSSSPAVGRTSQGIRLAASHNANSRHYSLSCEGTSLSDMAAATLARLILRLRNETGLPELFRGEHGVFHLVVHPPVTAEDVITQ